ncbi:MAG: AsmA-like C-terminal region-containing protein [Pseudomonadota bacterium]
MKVAELVVGDATLNDVQLDLTNDAPNAVGGNSLNVRRLAFTTVEGLEVDLASTVPDPTGAASSGPRRFVLRVPTRDALMQVFSVAGMSPKGDMLEKLAGATLPAAIAGRIEHDREAGRLALRYDGMLAGNTAVGQVEIVGSDADPAAREWTVVTDIDLAQPGVVTTALGLPKGLLSAREPDAPATPERGKKNRLVVYAIGRPADALRGDLVIETPDVDLRFAGTVQTARPARATATASSASTLGPLVVRGRIEGALNAGAPVRQLFALPETGPRGQRLAFSAELAHADARTRLDKLGFSLAEVEGSGAATVSWPSSGARIEAELKTSALSMARAAALVVEPPRDDSDTGLWPTRPFAFPPLGLTTMTARIEVGVLHLSDDARFSNVRATLEMDENGVRVSGLDGEAAGGRISGDAALAKRPAGAEFTVRIEGRSLSLAALAGASATPADGATESAGARAATVVPLADGPATTTPQSSDPAPVGQQPPLEGRLDLTLKARGIGLSPRGLVTVLSGAGEARMQRATVRDFSPQIIQDVAADVRDDNDPVDARMLKARLADRMDDRGLELGTHTLRLTVRDGVLDFAPLALSTPASRIEAKTFVDLARLRLDSEWRVAPLRASDVQPVSGAALPPVTVLYAGPLLRTEKIARDFAVAALERELTVRRLEGNIDQLEGVRALERAARRGQAALSPESGDDGAASDDDLPARPPRPTITGSVSPSAAETVPRPRGASRSDPSAIPPTPRIAPQAAPRPANPNVPRTTPRAARRSPPTRTRTRPRVTAPTPPVQGLWGQESVDGLTRDPPPLELELQTPAELGN